jgi:acetolactate decarboxylase
MEMFVHSLLWRRKEELLPPQLIDHEIYQVSTISALLEGVYDGEVTYGQVMRHGDFGIGTFNGLDGEMLAVHGVFYQVTAGGRVQQVSAGQKTPFAVVMYFRPDLHLKIDGPCTYEELQASIDEKLQSKNEFYGVLAEAEFEYLKARTIPKQQEPYLPMVEVVQTQIVKEYRNVQGLIAGFRFPGFAEKLNVPGYHLHFLDESRELGGHVLEAQLKNISVAIDHTSKFHMVLPEEGEFLQADLDGDISGDLKRVEGGS